MPQPVIEIPTATPDSPSRTPAAEGLGVVVQLDGRSMQSIPGVRKIVLALALAAAMASTAMGAFFLSGQATGTGAALQASVTQCPMTK